MKRCFFTPALSLCFILGPTAACAAGSFLPVVEDEQVQANAAGSYGACVRRVLSQEEQEALLLLKEAAEQDDLEAQRKMMKIYYGANHFEDALYWANRREKSRKGKGYADSVLIEFELNSCGRM